jgi:hypothetical protein
MLAQILGKNGKNGNKKCKIACHDCQMTIVGHRPLNRQKEQCIQHIYLLKLYSMNLPFHIILHFFYTCDIINLHAFQKEGMMSHESSLNCNLLLIENRQKIQ